MKNSLETRLGIFAALAVITAVVILEVIGSLNFKGTYRLHALFHNAHELKLGDTVKMAGVPIGKVMDLKLTNNLVRVTMRLNKDVTVLTSSRAAIRFAGLMGQNYVQVNFGDGASTLFVDKDFKDVTALIAKLSDVSNPVSAFLWSKLTPETKLVLADASVPADKQQAMLAKELNKIIKGDTIFATNRFAGVKLSAETADLVAQSLLDEDQLRCNRLLLEDAYPALIVKNQKGVPLGDDTYIQTVEQPDLNDIMTKLESVATGVENVTKTFSGDKLDNMLGPLTDLIKTRKDDISASILNLRTNLENMSVVTTDLKNGRGTVGKLLTEDTLYIKGLATVTTLEATAADVRATIAKAQSIITNVTEIVAQANAGRGTVGMLLTDKKLYTETTDAMAQLNEILHKVNRGEGSVGKLINDDSLIRNAKMTLQKLDKATEGLEDQGPLSVMGMMVNNLF
ncbi:MAG: MlaD family protein [Verrucomicrobiota bacterium]